MLIKHVTIRNAALKSTGKEKGLVYAYEMQVTLSHAPDSMWKQVFLLEWKKEFLFTKRNARLADNEIRVLLAKGDDIQRYIDTVKQLVEKADNRNALQKTKQEKGLRKLYDFANLRRTERYRIPDTAQDTEQQPLRA